MAKIKGINHLGYAVKHLDESIRSAEDNLGGELIIKFESIKQKYKGALIQFGESIISLIESTDENGFIATFVESRGEGIQHIGLEIDNLEEFVEQLESKGIRVDRTDIVVLQLMQWKAGPMDVSTEGKERIKQKYREVPGLRLVE